MFYRPMAWIGDLVFWGFRPIRVDRASLFTNAAEKVKGDPENVVPSGMVFSSALPETTYAVERRGFQEWMDPKAIHVLISEEQGGDIVALGQVTQSYFHFLMEVIPLALSLMSQHRVLVRITRQWQLGALDAFGIAYKQVDPITESLSPLIIRKRTWGVFPREDLLLGARARITQLFETDPVSKSPLGLYVARNRATSTTGRVLARTLEAVILDLRNFELYDPAADAVGDQFVHFSKASTLIGPHGSAFANVIASPRGATVVEITSSSRAQWHLKRITDILELNYMLVLGYEDTNGNLNLTPRTEVSLRSFLSMEA